MNSYLSVSVGLLMALLTASSVFGCNNFELKLEYARNPKGVSSLFTVSPDFNLILTDDCKIVPKGCVEVVSPGFKTAEVHYTLKLRLGMGPEFVLADKTENGCNMLKDAAQDKEALQIMNLFATPTSCPVPPKKVCDGNREVDISKFKSQLTDSTLTGNIDIKHENNLRSAIEFKGSIVRKNMLG